MMGRMGQSQHLGSPGLCGLELLDSHIPLCPSMPPQVRSQALQNVREVWGCPPGTGMSDPLGRTPPEFLCTLCLGTALTGNQVRVSRAPQQNGPLVLCPPCSWSPGLLVTNPFPRFTLSTAFFASSYLYSGDRLPHLPGLRFPSAPAASFPRTLSEYITNQRPLRW